MNKNLRYYIWELLSNCFRCLPAMVLQNVCRLAFEAFSRSHKPESGLVGLLRIQDVLKWYIDQQAIRYGKGIHPKHRLMDYHRFFIERLERGEHVLDVGCGQGAVSNSLAEAGIKVTGVDFNFDNISRAKQKYSHDNIRFIEADILVDPPPGPFSTIVMSNVLEHIEDRTTILKSLVRLYHPQRFLLRVPMSNRHWEVPLKQELGLPSFSDPTHCTEYTVECFAREMEEAGLAILSSQVIWGEIWSEVVPRA